MRAVQDLLDDVTVGRAGNPARFVYAGRTQIVTDVLDAWRYGGRWWLDEPPRDCYLVQAGTLTCELHHEDAPGGRWWLARVQD